MLAATNFKYDEVASRIVAGQADAAASLLKELDEDVFAADPLEVRVPDGHGAARARRHDDGGDRDQSWARCPGGQVMLCSVSSGQLPDELSLRQAIKPHPITVVTRPEWDVDYGVGPDRVQVVLMSLDTVAGGRWLYRGRAPTPPVPASSVVGTILSEGDEDRESHVAQHVDFDCWAGN